MKLIKGFVWMPLHFGCFHGSGTGMDGPIPFSKWRDASKAGRDAAPPYSDEEEAHWEGMEVYRMQLEVPEKEEELQEFAESRSLVLIANHIYWPERGYLVGPMGPFCHRPFFESVRLEDFGENALKRFPSLQVAIEARDMVHLWDEWYRVRIGRIKFRYVTGDACFERQEEWERRRAFRQKEGASA